MKNIKCRNCFFYRNEWCEKIVDSPDPEEARDCNYFREMTNADRIRSMSDEELATMLKDYKDCSKNCIISNGKHCYQICEEESVLLKWLQRPAEEDDHDERKENENV